MFNLGAFLRHGRGIFYSILTLNEIILESYSLQCKRFLTETQTYTDLGRHLERPRERPTSPLKSVIDSPQLSGSINVQDGRITLFPKKIMDRAAKYAYRDGWESY